MAICYIVGAGDCTERFEKNEGDLVIAADGGTTHLSRMGIVPDLFVGDFDSTDSAGAAPLVVRHPMEKDDTDMALAVREGHSRGYRDFRLYGALGGARFDHSVANLQLLLYCAEQGLRATLYHGDVRTRVLRNGEKMTFSAGARGYVSVFAFGGVARGVTLFGLKYPLEDGTLTPDLPLGVSNEFVGKEATVSVAEGNLLVIWQERGEEK